MSPLLRKPKLITVFSLWLLSLVTTGCTSVLTQTALPFVSAKAEETSLSPAESCVVELHGEFGKPRTISVPVSGDTRVQDVLEASRAAGKFRRMDLMIVRPAPRDPQQMVKLVCHYDPGERQVTWDTDYAVLPGDRVIVTQDASTVVDDVAERLFGPMLTSRKR